MVSHLRLKIRYIVVGLLIILPIVVAFLYPSKPAQPPSMPGMRCDDNGDVCWNRFDMKFNLIKAGPLYRGGQGDPKGEKAPPDVQIAQPYYLQITEVTQGQWISVMGKDSLNPSHFKDCSGCPVEMVSRNKAHEFISKLNQLEETNRYRLPTESEWEYACKADSEDDPPLGGNIKLLSDYAWYDNKVTGNKTHTVAKLQHNAWFLYDMLGNVWEWVEDDWHDNYKGAPNDGGAWIDKIRSQWGVLRGGSWYDNQTHINCTSRHKTESFKDLENAGFRCAWTKK